LGLLLFGLVAFQLSQIGEAGGEGSMIIKTMHRTHFSLRYISAADGAR
jgi:hypothetical protein